MRGRFKAVALPKNIYWLYLRLSKMHYLVRSNQDGSQTFIGSIYPHYAEGYKFRAQSLYHNDMSSQLFKTLRASKRFVERESYFKGAFK